MPSGLPPGSLSLSGSALPRATSCEKEIYWSENYLSNAEPLEIKAGHTVDVQHGFGKLGRRGGGGSGRPPHTAGDMHSASWL